MTLDSLYELIRDLERRIATEGAALRRSEALTRYALVDPLLRALGWDTEDARQVIPEYHSVAGVADYALFIGGSQPPAVIIEAKKLGEPLDDIGGFQSLNYRNLVGTPHFALTDGRIWKIYTTFEQAPLADRLIAEFAIGDMDAVEVCMKALALWRRSVDAGNVRTSSPILRWEQGEDERDNDTPVQDPTPQSDWIPLSEYEPRPYERLSEIKFPDDTTVVIKYQKGIIIETTRWLIRNGLLQPDNPDHCPIRSDTRYIISTGNVHSHGVPFVDPEWVDGVVCIETNAGNPLNIKNTCKVLTTVGQDPSAFKVKRAQGLRRRQIGR